MSGIGPMSPTAVGHLDPVPLGSDVATTLAKTNALMEAMKSAGLMVRGSAYRDAIIASAPVFYARLGDTSGTAAAAVVGSNGLYVNTPTLGVAGLLSGDPSTAVSFNEAQAEYATASVPASGWGAFSAAVWVNCGAIVSKVMFSAVDTGGTFTELLVSAGGLWTFRVVNSSGATSNVGTQARTDGTHMIVGTYNASNDAVVYVDGIAAGAAALGAAAKAPAGGLAIASRQTPSFQFHGTMAEVTVWNRSLGAAEVAALYAIGTGA